MMVLFGHIIYLLAYILVFILSHLLYIFLPKKIKQWVKLKTQFKTFSKISDSSKKTYWFHAASGEIEYAKSVIRELRTIHRDSIIIVVTYSSPSAPNLFNNIRNEVDAFIPLCWDLDIFNNRLIKLINPSVVIFARTDFWPRLIYNLKKQNIPVCAISLFVRNGFLQKTWFKFVLTPMKFITCVNPSNQSYLKNILPNNLVEFVPDTRFDQVIHRLESPTKIEFTQNSNNKFFTVGSSWPNDDAVITPALKNILDLGYKVIWVPHELQHADPLALRLKSLYPDIRLVLFSNCKIENQKIDLKDCDILIVDRIGYLADFYRFSTISFVGGSFVGKVHSVMEPLCAGNAVIVGPYHQNSPEALYFKYLNVVVSVMNFNELQSAFTQLHNNETATKAILKKELVKFTGGTKKNVALINQLISR